mmetsp:Transcript_2265/g.4662  ORF Transcript_2265/g.4662 Transcript_2265/m.4662 type:complete len:568 (-) Transcript_2265:370-2073(-)
MVGRGLSPIRNAPRPAGAGLGGDRAGKMGLPPLRTSLQPGDTSRPVADENSPSFLRFGPRLQLDVTPMSLPSTKSQRKGKASNSNRYNARHAEEAFNLFAPFSLSTLMSGSVIDTVEKGQNLAEMVDTLARSVQKDLRRISAAATGKEGGKTTKEVLPEGAEVEASTAMSVDDEIIMKKKLLKDMRAQRESSTSTPSSAQPSHRGGGGGRGSTKDKHGRSSNAAPPHSQWSSRIPDLLQRAEVLVVGEERSQQGGASVETAIEGLLGEVEEVRKKGEVGGVRGRNTGSDRGRYSAAAQVRTTTNSDSAKPSTEYGSEGGGGKEQVSLPGGVADVMEVEMPLQGGMKGSSAARHTSSLIGGRGGDDDDGENERMEVELSHTAAAAGDASERGGGGEVKSGGGKAEEGRRHSVLEEWEKEKEATIHEMGECVKDKNVNGDALVDIGLAMVALNAAKELLASLKERAVNFVSSKLTSSLSVDVVPTCSIGTSPWREVAVLLTSVVDDVREVVEESLDSLHTPGANVLSAIAAEVIMQMCCSLLSDTSDDDKEAHRCDNRRRDGAAALHAV